MLYEEVRNGALNNIDKMFEYLKNVFEFMGDICQ